MPRQPKVTHELEVDDDGQTVWVSRAHLGHLSGVTDYDLPSELWTDLERARDAYADACSHEAEARATYDSTRGRF
jgi:hypothetical protein